MIAGLTLAPAADAASDSGVRGVPAVGGGGSEFARAVNRLLAQADGGAARGGPPAAGVPAAGAPAAAPGDAGRALGTSGALPLPGELSLDSLTAVDAEALATLFTAGGGVDAEALAALFPEGGGVDAEALAALLPGGGAATEALAALFPAGADADTEALAALLSQGDGVDAGALAALLPKGAGVDAEALAALLSKGGDVDVEALAALLSDAAGVDAEALDALLARGDGREAEALAALLSAALAGQAREPGSTAAAPQPALATALREALLQENARDPGRGRAAGEAALIADRPDSLSGLTGPTTAAQTAAALRLDGQFTVPGLQGAALSADAAAGPAGALLQPGPAAARAAEAAPPPLPAGAPLPAQDARAALSQTLEHVTWMSREGVHQARLQLDPPHLGRIDIRLDLEGGEARLQLGTQHAPVREALEAVLPRLREALAGQGMDLTDASVSHSGEDDSGQESTARGGFPADLGEDAWSTGDDDGDRPRGAPAGAGLLDLYA